MYKITELLLVEGGEWYPVKPVVMTNDGELEKAMSMVTKRSTIDGIQSLAKLPNIGAIFHAFRLENGNVWDAVNGWRT